MTIHRYQCPEVTANPEAKVKKKKKRKKAKNIQIDLSRQFLISELQKGHHHQKRKSMLIFAERNRSKMNKFGIYIKYQEN